MLSVFRKQMQQRRSSKKALCGGVAGDKRKGIKSGVPELGERWCEKTDSGGKQES